MTYERIDIDEALAQLGGSQKLYSTLVNGFYEKYEKVDNDIKGLLEENELEEARRLAHSIKGLSGNLGANVLKEKAKELEYAIRDQRDDIDICLHNFSYELKDVIGEVKVLLGENEKETANKNISDSVISNYIEESDEEFIKVCHDMIAALETYKYGEVKSAKNRFDRVKVSLKYKGQVMEALAYIEDYDYDLAIEVFKEMVKK